MKQDEMDAVLAAAHDMSAHLQGADFSTTQAEYLAILESVPFDLSVHDTQVITREMQIDNADFSNALFECLFSLKVDDPRWSFNRYLEEVRQWKPM